MPLRSQGYCGVGKALSDSTGFGAVEEVEEVEAGTSVFLSISELDLSVHAELGQESQASSCVD